MCLPSIRRLSRYSRLAPVIWLSRLATTNEWKKTATSAEGILLFDQSRMARWNKLDCSLVVRFQPIWLSNSNGATTLTSIFIAAMWLTIEEKRIHSEIDVFRITTVCLRNFQNGNTDSIMKRLNSSLFSCPAFFWTKCRDLTTTTSNGFSLTFTPIYSFVLDRFEARIAVPENVDVESIESSYLDGILTITAKHVISHHEKIIPIFPADPHAHLCDHPRVSPGGP